MAEEKSTTTDKKSVYKKWWFWVIIVIVVVGIYELGKSNGTKVCGNNNNSNTSQTETKKGSAVSEDNNKSNTDQTVTKKDLVIDKNNNSLNTNQTEAKKDFVIGDVIPFKGGEISVNSVERNYNTGNSYYVPKKGKEFVKVNLLIENKDNDNLHYSSNDWKMQDSNGAMESYVVTPSNDDCLEFGDLIKGGKKTGSLVFEVPKDDKGLVLHYRPSSYHPVDEIKIKL